MPKGDLPKGARIDAEGVWVQVLRVPEGTERRPTLFLDRDGVVVVEVNYLHRVEDTRLVPGAAQLIARANRRGVPVVIITNQAGVGRGLYGWDAFMAVQEKLLDDLAREDALIDAVFACPHHVVGRPPYNVPDHPARKPNPGMLHRAQRLLPVDLPRSWVVGDRASDLEAGKSAGLAGGVHVLSGHGWAARERRSATALGDERFRALTAPTIAEARTLLPILGSVADV